MKLILGTNNSYEPLYRVRVSNTKKLLTADKNYLQNTSGYPEHFYVDFKQLEECVLAQLCKEPTLIRLLKEGKDIHKVIRSNVYDIPEEEIPSEVTK